ncbi:hypothetical protein Tco_1037194 [Tanacetum coccineum]
MAKTTKTNKEKIYRSRNERRSRKTMTKAKDQRSHSMKEKVYNIIKTKDLKTQRQSNLKKFKEAKFKISPQEFEDHTLGEIVSLKICFEHESSEFAGSLASGEIASLKARKGKRARLYYISDNQDADDEDAETESDEDEIYKYKIHVRKDADVEMSNAEVEDSDKSDEAVTNAAKADAEKTSEVKDDAKKTKLPPTSSSLSVSSSFGVQFLKLSSDSSLVSTVKGTTDA